MNKKSSYVQFIVSAAVIFGFFLSSFCTVAQSKAEFHQSILNTEWLLKNTKKYEAAVLKKDTATQIQALINIAYFYGTQAKYKNSYDRLWQALKLAETSKNLSAIASINQKIGRHYGYYRRKEAALTYFQKAIDTGRELMKQDSTQQAILANTYHQMCSFYRDLGDVVMQKRYIDSCSKYVNPKINTNLPTFLGMERAVVLTEERKYAAAEQLFDQHFNEVNENFHTYLVLYAYYQGVNYYHLKQANKAKQKLMQALEVANTYNAHLDFSPKIYQMLAQIALEEGKYEQGIEMLNQMTKINFDFFDSRSTRNESLLEIQDAQRRDKENQQKRMQLLELSELKNAQKTLFFQRAVLVLGILLLSLAAVFYVKNLTQKYELEKKLTQKKQEVEFEKVREIIELKNKELALSTLKLIEKAELVDDFAASLKNKNWRAESKDLKQFIKSWDLSVNKNWAEFQSRFTSINNTFYARLHEEFPHLSASDDKLCALIKLKLSSKEISRLLGLSNESVHTKRSRLRSKLGLEREINLTEFLDRF